MTRPQKGLRRPHREKMRDREGTLRGVHTGLLGVSLGAYSPSGSQCAPPDNGMDNQGRLSASVHSQSTVVDMSINRELSIAKRATGALHNTSAS